MLLGTDWVERSSPEGLQAGNGNAKPQLGEGIATYNLMLRSHR